MPKSKLSCRLFESATSVYALIDAAKIEDLTTQLLICEPEYCNLFEDMEAMELEEVSPYLVRLYKKDIFTEWVLDNVYGSDGAIFLQSNYDIESLQRHLRKYLYVSREIEHPDTKKPVIQEGVLAYYDPRVLPEWLESIDESTKQSFLSVSECVYYEDMQNKSVLHFYTIDGEQHTESLEELECG